jgi:hypothetical protein
LKKPMELDITMPAALGLDTPTKMLALAVEAAEASQREFTMVFDGWRRHRLLGPAAGARDRPNGGGSTWRGGPGIAIPTTSLGTPRSTSGVICIDREPRPGLQGLNT